MRILMNIKMPNEPFNTLVRHGTVTGIMRSLVDNAKPEAVYFTEENGTRSVIMVVNMKDTSEVPAYAEPWFLNFDASCEMRVAMTPADLEKAGIDKIAHPGGR